MIRTKLAQLKKNIDDDDMCARLLQTLPKEYDHISVTWHDLPETEKTWAKLSRRCINYELRLTGRDEVEAATVMISKTTVSAKSTKKNASTGEKASNASNGSSHKDRKARKDTLQ